jgi:hypothetical protein
LAERAAAALGRSISPSTVWRILDSDAIQPWRYEYWIIPRDPEFSQARIRCHATLPTGPGRPMRVEHEYERGGALQYLAAWDVRRGRVLGRCEEKTGIDSFGRLVGQVMRIEPYRYASRVFWVVDNGSPHRGQAAVTRLRKAYRKAVLVHTPGHASWLNQVEIYDHPEESPHAERFRAPGSCGAAAEAVRRTEQSRTAPLRLEIRSSRLAELPGAIGGKAPRAARGLGQLVRSSSRGASQQTGQPIVKWSTKPAVFSL